MRGGDIFHTVLNDTGAVARDGIRDLWHYYYYSDSKPLSELRNLEMIHQLLESSQEVKQTDKKFINPTSIYTHTSPNDAKKINETY